MRQFGMIAFAAVSAAVLVCASLAHAQYGREESRPRNQGGSVNLAPANPILQVVSVDSYSQVVQMRNADGKTFDVYVGADIYDISKLKAGDKVQVDFLVADGTSNKLKAANVYPVN